MRAEPLREQQLELRGLGPIECGEQAPLVLEVRNKGRVDDGDPLFGKPDDPAACIRLGLPACHIPGLDESVDALGDRAGCDHGVLGKLPRRPFVRLARSPQSREHVELPLGQPVFGIQRNELFGQGTGEPVESADDSDRGDVEFGALAVPIGLDAGDVIVDHAANISSGEAILVSVENIRVKWLLVAAIAPVAWGSTYFVTRQLLPADIPLWGAVIRALPAGLILLAIARERPRGSWWWKSLVLGTLNVGAFFILVYVAAQLLPTSVASTLMALSAVVIPLVAWPLLAERPRLIALVGAAIGFGGVGLMLFTDVAELNPWGAVASVAAMVMSSIGFILAKRWGTDTSALSITAWQLIAGSLLVAPVALAVEGPLPVLDGPAILGFAYVTIVATAIANVAWLVALRNLPATSVGLIGLLNPVTGVALGVLIAAEVFGVQQAIGVALVLAGVLLGQYRRRPTIEGYVQPRTRHHLPG